MATRLKTVEFAFPALASMTDAVLTSMTQITVYLPETGTKNFVSVTATSSAMGTATATGNVTSRQLQCRLGAATYTSNTNSNLYTGSGEDIFCYHAVDLTDHFNTNWSGTSMTMDAQVMYDGTATSIAWTNVTVTVRITYEYDDTSTTQVKTVRIPLDAPEIALTTSKPGTALATIPNLSTELPEASKVFRSTYVVIQGNHGNASGTTDHTLSMQLDTTTANTTGTFESVSATDYWFRYIWNVASVLNTSSSMGFYLWANVAKFAHLQVWLVVTYEFNASASNDVFVSLQLPMDTASPMGGSTSADYQRGTRELFIEEPGMITTKQIAFYAFWDQIANIGGLNMRIGTGSFTSYTDTAAVLAGNNGAMCRNDSAFTLARGRNKLNFDIYRTDTTNLGYNISGFWIINYTASKPGQGYGAANHTVIQNMGMVFDGAPVTLRDTAATSISIPEADFYITSMGTNFQYFTNSTTQPAGITVLAERLTSEGGHQWEPAYIDVSFTDPETGLRNCWSQVRSLFQRFPGDADTDRMDMATARRWRCVIGSGGTAVSTAFGYLDIYFSYHTITYAVADTISGFTGTVDIGLHRADGNSTNAGELVKTTSRSGDGAFSFSWYDNTENLYISASDGTHVGRSTDDLAS